MFRKNVSGQFVYFSLVSTSSGLPITGASGSISGRRAIDGGSVTLLSGFVGEDAGGLYHANLFDFDVNGNNIGLLFSASGATQVTFTVTTDGSVSGRIYPASGVNTVVPSASLSGVVANSGLFVSVPIATLSGVIANSGLFVSVPRATLSGVVINSGAFVSVPAATISGVVANSGLFVNALLADGVAHGGFTASLVLSQLVIANPAGNGITVQATGGDGIHIAAAGGQDINLAGSQKILGNLNGFTTAALSQLLGADISGSIEGAASIHSLATLILKLTSKFDSLTGKTYRTDGVTVHMTQAVTTNAAAVPITKIDVGV